MKRALLFVCAPLALAVLVLFAGCGGGGGPALAKLVYATDWTLRASPGGGLSQRVQVYDADGRLLTTLVVNQDVDGVQQTTLSGITSGTRRLFVELFSARDLGGIKTGELEALLTVSGTTTFSSAASAMKGL